LRDVHDLVAETLIDTPDVLAEGLSHLEGHLAFVVRRVDLAPRREDEHAVVVAAVVHTRRLETEEVRVADEIAERVPDGMVDDARAHIPRALGGRRADEREEERDNQRSSASELHHGLSSSKILRCHRSSSTVQPFCFTFNHRLVAPPSYTLASSFAT